MRVTNISDLPAPIAKAAIKEFMNMYVNGNPKTMSHEEYAVKTMNHNLKQGMMAFNYLRASNLEGVPLSEQFDFWVGIFVTRNYERFYEKFPMECAEEIVIDNVKYVL